VYTTAEFGTEALQGVAGSEVSDGEDGEDGEPLYGDRVARKEDGTWVLRETRRRVQGAVMVLYEHSMYTRAGHVMTCAFMFQAGIGLLKLALFTAAFFGLDAVVLPMYRATRGNYTLSGFDAVRPGRYCSPRHPTRCEPLFHGLDGIWQRMTRRAISARPYTKGALSRNAYMVLTYFIAHIIILICEPVWGGTLLRVLLYEPGQSAFSLVVLPSFICGRFRQGGY